MADDETFYFRGKPLVLEQRPSELLALLYDQKGKPVSKDDLAEALRIYKGRRGRRALYSAADKIRKALDDRKPHHIVIGRHGSYSLSPGFIERGGSQAERKSSRQDDSTFVGREEEQAVVEVALERAHLGGGAFVWVGGESGIGKSRFAAEITKKAERRGFETSTGQCSELGIPFRALQRL